MLMPEIAHITVCICTYKRPRYLAYLLERLANEQTASLFTFSIVVVDNDSSRSAEPAVTAFANSSVVQIEYLVEPQQGISLARNMAVRHARGEFIAFIDDDEFPGDGWLKKLFVELQERQVDGVLGPVKPRYESEPPKWVVDGRFYNRVSYPTGLVIDGSKGRTGNVLFRSAILEGETEPFRPIFRSGEDQDFFQRMISKGFVFTWCNEAMAYEWVPAIRWNRKFLIRRALLRGTVSVSDPNAQHKDIFKSILAVSIYLLLLPLAFLFSQGKFMSFLVSFFNHVGKLLALLKINVISEQYIIE